MYGGINEFRRGYQPKYNVVISNLPAYSHNILNRQKNHFSQLLNPHGFSDARQIEIYTAQLFVPDPSSLETEIPISKLKSINRQEVIKFRQN
jgi:hypothetical protein